MKDAPARASPVNTAARGLANRKRAGNQMATLPAAQEVAGIAAAVQKALTDPMYRNPKTNGAATSPVVLGETR